MGEWIEKETELAAAIKAKSEEIPGIIVGGNIASVEQINGKGGDNSQQSDPIPAAKLTNGNASLQDRMHAVVLGGGLFNIAAEAQLIK